MADDDHIKLDKIETWVQRALNLKFQCVSLWVAIFKVQVTIGPVMNHPEMTVTGISHLLVHVCIMCMCFHSILL